MRHFLLSNRQIVTTEDIILSRDRVKLVCGFYGPTHPECKKAINNDSILYINFLKQFTHPLYPKDDDKN